MRPFKNWKLWTMTGSAILGAFYGLAMTLILNSNQLSHWSMIIPVISGSALGASAASALCRMYEIWNLIRKRQRFPNHDTLHYRGVRYVTCDLSTIPDPREREMTVKGSQTTACLTKQLSLP